MGKYVSQLENRKRFSILKNKKQCFKSFQNSFFRTVLKNTYQTESEFTNVEFYTNSKSFIVILVFFFFWGR